MRRQRLLDVEESFLGRMISSLSALFFLFLEEVATRFGHYLQRHEADDGIKTDGHIDAGDRETALQHLFYRRHTSAHVIVDGTSWRGVICLGIFDFRQTKLCMDVLCWLVGRSIAPMYAVMRLIHAAG